LVPLQAVRPLLYNRAMASSPETPMNPRRSGFRVSLFLIWTGVFIGVMAYNWAAWPNASIMFGPFWIVRYNGLDPGLAFCILILLSMLFAFPAKPNVFTALVSAAGLCLWFVAGMVGEGIGC
jgi:hypothetical protein